VSVPTRRFVNVGIPPVSFIPGESVGNESIDDQGTLYQWYGPTRGWVISGGNGATLVTDAAPKVQVTPTIGSVTTGNIFVDLSTTAQIVGMKATINPGDPVIAANRLALGYPDTVFISADETQEILSESAVTNVTLAVLTNIAVTETAYDPVTKTATGTIYSNTTAASFNTVMVQFDFSLGDDVRKVVMSLKTMSDGTTSGNLGIINIAGYSA